MEITIKKNLTHSSIQYFAQAFVNEKAVFKASATFIHSRLKITTIQKAAASCLSEMNVVLTMDETMTHKHTPEWEKPNDQKIKSRLQKTRERQNHHQVTSEVTVIWQVMLIIESTSSP